MSWGKRYRRSQGGLRTRSLTSKEKRMSLTPPRRPRSPELSVVCVSLRRLSKMSCVEHLCWPLDDLHNRSTIGTQFREIIDPMRSPGMHIGQLGLHVLSKRVSSAGAEAGAGILSFSQHTRETDHVAI
jgi:hypothetical protein